MLQPLIFKIYGMDCPDEVVILKQEVGPIVGGEERLAFDILNARMIVAYRPAEVAPNDIMKAVAATGMRAEIWNEDAPDDEGQGFWQRHSRSLATAVSGLMTASGFWLHAESMGVAAALGYEGARFVHDAPMDATLCYSGAILSGAWFVLPKTWLSIRRMRPDMNLLMSVAIAGAVIIGEWFEGAMVAFLFALSLAMESWSVGRARKAVASLLDLTPISAHLLRTDGSEYDVRPEEVPVTGRVRIRPGERIPVDGFVVKGSSAVDQAPITGESMPVFKEIGDAVYAGTINGDGSIEASCSKTATDTTLAGIVRMVGQAQSKRAPSEQWVERFARIYTPAVMVASVLICIVPPLLMGLPWSDWFYRALVLLVIGCPCALVISTPVSIVAALAAAARNGVLVKGGVYLEACADLNAIAFDKTGTLTAGRPTVVDITALDGYTEDDLLARAAAMEVHSDHPIARAVVDCAQERFIRLRSADDFQMLPGRGATATFDGVQFWIGSLRYLEERGLGTDTVLQTISERANLGQTAVVIGNEDGVCGIIAIEDTAREGAKDALKRLRESGIRHLVMLTGDNNGTAQVIANQTGIDVVHAELLPEDKVAVIETLVSTHEKVAMVGDGVNDAPAMGRATLGIAMGAVGSDVAIETADIALMTDDLSRLPWLVNHARRTLMVIRQNIGIALTIKVLFVLLTVMGYASLWAAIGADMGASLLVIFNGLLLMDGSEND